MFERKNKSHTAAFEQINPVYSYQDDKVIFRDGRVAVAFLVHPPEMESWQPDDFYATQDALVGALRVLPAETVVQKSDIYYDRRYRPQTYSGGYFENRMNNHFADRLVLFDRTYLFISFAPSDADTPRRTNPFSALVSRLGERLTKNPFSGVVKTLSTAESAANELVAALRGVGGIEFERLRSNHKGVNEIQNVYLQYFNLEFDEQPDRLEREISNEPGGFAVGEHRITIVSLTGQGAEAHPAVRNTYGVTSPMLYPVTSFLKCPHIVTQALMVQDVRTALAELDGDRRVNQMVLNVPYLANQDTEVRVNEIAQLTAEARADNKMLVGLHLSVLLWDVNDQQRRENVTQTLKALRSAFGAVGVVESYLNLSLFFGLLPGNAYQIPDRWISTTADRGSCYLYWTTSYRPEPGGLYLNDRHGNLVTVNLFNEANDNQNALLIGPTGSGKSYTFGYFITQRYESGARQIILDLGGTYRNVVQSTTGADFERCYFEYDPQNPLEFNPFLVPRDPETGHWLYVGNEDKKNFHLGLLTVLWKGGKDRGLNKPERAILTRFLEQYYQELNHQPNLGQAGSEDFPGMESFYRFMKRYDEQMQQPDVVEQDPAQAEIRRQYKVNSKYLDITEFFLVLGEFITGGRYAKILNSPRDKDLSEYRLICFDLGKIKADPTLYPLVGMLITELALDLTRNFPDDIKYIALDEAWAMLAGVLEDFIVTMYRTVRKNKGSITIITQGLKEILDSPVGLTLIENAETKIILRHKNEGALMRLQQPLAFTDHEIDLIRSLKLRSSKTSREIFIKQGAFGRCYGVEVAPEINPVLTSKPTERSAFNKLVRFYQQSRQVEVRDETGNLVRDKDGLPVYETVIEPRLAAAAAQYVEDQQKRKGARLAS